MLITSDMLLNAPASNQTSGSAGRAQARGGSGTPVFRLEPSQNDRISGSVPVWGRPASARENVAQNLTDIALGNDRAADSAKALSLSPATPASAEQDESFGVFDLIDMINPLQHIPIVSTLYRAVTGDTIKPISQIIGGAAFGGFIGAAGGIANAIVTAETGRDIGENVMGFISGDKPAHTDLPGTTIAMANLSYRAPRYND